MRFGFNKYSVLLKKKNNKKIIDNLLLKKRIFFTYSIIFVRSAKDFMRYGQISAPGFNQFLNSIV